MTPDMKTARASIAKSLGGVAGLVRDILERNEAALTTAEIQIGQSACAVLEALQGQLRPDEARSE